MTARPMGPISDGVVDMAWSIRGARLHSVHAPFRPSGAQDQAMVVRQPLPARKRGEAPPPWERGRLVRLQARRACIPRFQGKLRQRAGFRGSVPFWPVLPPSSSAGSRTIRTQSRLSSCLGPASDDRIFSAPTTKYNRVGGKTPLHLVEGPSLLASRGSPS